MNFHSSTSFSNPGGWLVPLESRGYDRTGGDDGGGGDPPLGGGQQLSWLVALLRDCLQGFGEEVVQHALGTNVRTQPASTLSGQAASGICGYFAPTDKKTTQQDVENSATVELSFLPIEQRGNYLARLLQMSDRMRTDPQFARFVRDEHTKFTQRSRRRVFDE